MLMHGICHKGTIPSRLQNDTLLLQEAVEASLREHKIVTCLSLSESQLSLGTTTLDGARTPLPALENASASCLCPEFKYHFKIASNTIYDRGSVAHQPPLLPNNAS